ncbi:unnamed protein product [Schistosoma margrebowiei]|uniref:Uncharacterized protein n=1 Tax=Schistosoma margrebowiei TaxID=48269 RepID=A0A3P7XXA6_9TREM|nr:unnamed protein product [Schistosoma margrebowiei]
MNPGFVLFDTRQRGVPIILRELVLPDGFDPKSSSYTETSETLPLSYLGRD